MRCTKLVGCLLGTDRTALVRDFDFLAIFLTGHLVDRLALADQPLVGQQILVGAGHLAQFDFRPSGQCEGVHGPPILFGMVPASGSGGRFGLPTTEHQRVTNTILTRLRAYAAAIMAT